MSNEKYTTIGGNRTANHCIGVPKYSEKYKDVLERATKREQALKIKTPTLFFYRVRSIGVGAFSFVYLVTEENSGTVYAQKSISKKSIAPELLTEIKLHLRLSHANIVNLYHVYSEEDYMQLIMDYAGDSLFLMRKNHKLHPTQNLQLIISILTQLVEAVYYLHENNIVHADIKLENILYLHGAVKLCDFGYAHPCLPKPFYQTITINQNQIVGTLEYLAPEYVQGYHSEFPRDIWAIGIVAYELLVGKNPMEGFSENEKWSYILKIHEINTKDLAVSKDIQELLEMTLCRADKRASIHEIRQLRLFRKEREFHEMPINMSQKIFNLFQ